MTPCTNENCRKEREELKRENEALHSLSESQQQRLNELSLIVERQREVIMFAQVNATAFPDECAKRLKEALALAHPSNELSAMRKVIEAARKLNFWCSVTHKHFPGNYKEFYDALAELDRSRGGV